MNKAGRVLASPGTGAVNRAGGTGGSAAHGGDETATGFLRSVTHDLKGPLTAIRGQAQLLQMRASRQGRAADVKAATAIIEQAQRMTGMLDGLLEAILAQDGKLALALAPLNLLALASAAVDAARGNAPARALTIHAVEQDLVIDGDAVRLARVFDNLLGSALRRSTPDRQVQITLQRRGREILVTIGDAAAGAGLAEAPEVSGQVSSRQAEPSGAVDLPVYVSQRIVEAHGGRFWMSTSPGGIQLTFALPARTTRSGPPDLPSTG